MLTKFFTMLRKDTRGQDVIEYALMLGFVAVTVGAIAPTLWEKVKPAVYKVREEICIAAVHGNPQAEAKCKADWNLPVGK